MAVFSLQTTVANPESKYLRIDHAAFPCVLSYRAVWTVQPINTTCKGQCKPFLSAAMRAFVLESDLIQRIDVPVVNMRHGALYLSGVRPENSLSIHERMRVLARPRFFAPQLGDDDCKIRRFLFNPA